MTSATLRAVPLTLVLTAGLLTPAWAMAAAPEPTPQPSASGQSRMQTFGAPTSSTLQRDKDDDNGNGKGNDKGKGKGKKDRVQKDPVDVSVNTGPTRKVGVGQLVTISFSEPVARKKAVERAIKVKSTKKLPVGAWAWFGDQTAIYRPKRFWPGKAHIRFNLNLDDVVLSRVGNTKYVGNERSGRTAVLRTGRQFVMRIKDSKHHMYVRINGRTRKVFPVSLGKPGYETRSGVKILTGEKYTTLRMTGTDRFSGETWDVMSPYSIRLTPTGEFIHGAPWAYARLGLYNGSHGCTNMYIDDAHWLFNRVIPGDPVVTSGTGRPMEVSNGTPGSYWNYSYATWKRL